MLGDRPSFEDVRPVVQVAMEEYLAGEVSSVNLLYSRFVSTVRQVPTLMRLLPVELPERASADGQVKALYLWEPEPEAVLDALLPRYVEAVVYQALLEPLASEHAARMVAMQNATDNAQELITALTLTRNKVRQATITRELMDIVSGAEALSAR
jgi:F-type H+-transporting ATPase subunit gamma